MDKPASTVSTTVNPSLHTLRWVKVTISDIPCSVNSSLIEILGWHQTTKRGFTVLCWHGLRGTRMTTNDPFRQCFLPSSERMSRSRYLWRISISIMTHDRLLHLPASITLLPLLIPSQDVMNAISARYRIWVRCGNDIVHSSGVGRRTWMKPFPVREPIFDPKGSPIKSSWR